MRRLAAGFVVSVLVLACSLCSANTLSDQEIIERTFQTFVEGMQELDIAKVLSVLAEILPQTPWKLKMTAPNNSDKMTLGRPKYQMVKRSCHNESISGKARDRQYRH